MITFIDLAFSPDGAATPTVLARLLRVPGVTSVMGAHDVMFHWRSNAEFETQMLAIHRALHGSGATYRVCTVEDSYQSLDPVPWVAPGVADPPPHPAIPERRPTGLDTLGASAEPTSPARRRVERRGSGTSKGSA